MKVERSKTFGQRHSESRSADNSNSNFFHSNSHHFYVSVLFSNKIYFPVVQMRVTYNAVGFLVLWGTLRKKADCILSWKLLVGLASDFSGALCPRTPSADPCRGAMLDLLTSCPLPSNPGLWVGVCGRSPSQPPLVFAAFEHPFSEQELSCNTFFCLAPGQLFHCHRPVASAGTEIPK